MIKNENIPIFSIINLTTQVAEPTPTGEVIETALQEWQQRNLSIKVVEKAIMPDHIHLCINVIAYLPRPLYMAISSLKGMITRGYFNSLPQNSRPRELQPVFCKGFNDKIAYDEEQWQNQIRYTLDNPRRYALKKQFPNYLQQRWELTFKNEKLTLLGNIFLLREPWLFPVKFSRGYSEQKGSEVVAQWHQLLQNGAVPISPFIHPKERELQKYAIDNGYPYIKVCLNGFSERETAQGAEFELMANGRILLIAPAEYRTQKTQLRYEYAQKLNLVARELANACNSRTKLQIKPTHR